MDAYTNAGGGDGTVWFVVLTVVLAAFALYSAILIYHWFTFSMKPHVAIMATIVYGAVGAVFIVGMISSALALT